MAAPKGNKFSKGKPKGSKNSKTIQWETFSEYCLNGGLERFQEELEGLEGKDFINAFLTMLEYHKPKLARIDQDITSKGEKVNIPIIDWVKSDKDK